MKLGLGWAVAFSLLAAACGSGGDEGSETASSGVDAAPQLRHPEWVDEPIVQRVQELRAQIESDPQNADLRAELGRVFDANGMPELALAAYGQAVNLDPASARAWHSKGRMHVELNQSDAALEAWGRAASLNPSHAPIHWRRGRVFLTLDDLDAAEQAFERACEVAPRDPSGWVGLARVELQRGQPERAKVHLERALREAPNDGYIHQLLGRALRDGGDLEAAQKHFARDDGTSTAWSDAWESEVFASQAGYLRVMDESRALLVAGELEQAYALVRPLYREQPDEIAVMGLAMACLIGLGRFDEALAGLTASEERGVRHYKVDMHFALVYKKTGRPKEALERVRRVVGVKPDWAPAYRLMGELQMELHDYSSAAEAFRAAQEGGAINYSATLTYGRALGLLGRWSEAVGVFERATRDYPNKYSHYFYLASALGEQGRIDDARAALNEGRRRKPDSPLAATIDARLRDLEHGQ